MVTTKKLTGNSVKHQLEEEEEEDEEKASHKKKA